MTQEKRKYKLDKEVWLQHQPDGTDVINGLIKKLPEENIKITEDARKGNIITRLRRQSRLKLPEKVIKNTFLTGVALTAWLNWGIDRRETWDNDINNLKHSDLSSPESLFKGDKTKDLVKSVSEDVCKEIHSWDFFTRFFYTDEKGDRKFNWGVTTVPLGFEVAKKCGKVMDIQVILPSDFMPDFRNKKTLSEEDEMKIVNALANLFNQKISDEVVMQAVWEGSSGAMDVYVTNKKRIDPKTGRIIFNLNNLKVLSLKMQGLASDEAAVGGNEKSIGSKDLQNERLAKERLDAVYETFKKEFGKVGLYKELLEHIDISSLEKVLNTSEVTNLAKIYDLVFPGNNFDVAKKVFELIRGHNSNDRQIIDFLNRKENREYYNLFQHLIVYNRGVKVSMKVEGEYTQTQTYHVVIPLFFVLVLLFNLPGKKRRIREAKELDRLINFEGVEVVREK
jgi:hypothetical protein